MYEVNTKTNYIQMDYKLQTPEERKKKVEEIIANTPPEELTSNYLEKLADYIIFAMDKQERKEKKILTANRMVTVNKRERSFEGLAATLENGEDGLYGMMTEDKNILFTPKISITEQDIQEIPGLASLRAEIDKLQKLISRSYGRKVYYLKKQLIEMRMDQYVLKMAYKKPINSMNLIKSLRFIDLSEDCWINEKGEPESLGILSMFNPKHITLVLQNYSRLKQESYSDFVGDTKWLIMDLENTIDKAIKDKNPVLFKLLVYKIDKKQNIEIQKLLNEEFDIHYSMEHLSTLWRNKIPKMIAQQNKEDYLIYHYSNEEKGRWKRCSQCGQYKLAHRYFFSKNNTSKDGYYSMCKECRNKRIRENKAKKLQTQLLLLQQDKREVNDNGSEDRLNTD